MAVAEELIQKMFGYVNDINPKEIASQIESGHLLQWTETWGISFKRLIREVMKCYEDAHGWIFVMEAKPRSEEIVQLLVYDDHGDYPDIYVSCGFRYAINKCGVDDIWISADDTSIFHDSIVAWKPLQEPLKLKELQDLGWLKQ